MKCFLILLLIIESVYSQYGFLDSLKVFQSPFFREATKLAANTNFPRFSGLSNSNPTSSCNICSISNADEINYYTRLAQQLANENNFPNNQRFPENTNYPQISNTPPPDYGYFAPPTPAPLERRPSFKYPEIKNSLNGANSHLKTIGGPKAGGLDLIHRIGK